MRYTAIAGQNLREYGTGVEGAIAGLYSVPHVFPN